MDDIINEVNQDVELKQNNILIIISGDKMSGYLRIEHIDKTSLIAMEDVLTKIDEYLITYGIDIGKIKNYLNKSDFNNDLKFALGQQPIKGEDGVVTYVYNKNDIGVMAKREDGTIDYKNLGIIQNVKSGELLCCFKHPTEGFPGYNIHGEVVPPKKGAEIPDVRGNNTSLTEDGLGLYADVDGYIIYQRDKISIQEVYTVNGDVGPETGNIDFSGAVIVLGNVLEGFSVKAKKDITIKGMVEGANITSEGSVNISNGFNGMGKGLINSQVNIVSRFIENGTVICKGNITADTLLNSNVSVGKSVVLKGSRSAIIGGKCLAGQSVFANILGTDHNLTTEVSIKPYWYEIENGLYYPNQSENVDDKANIIKDLKVLKEQEEELLKELGSLRTLRIAPEKREDKNKLLKHLMLEKAKIVSNIMNLDQRLKEIENFEQKNKHSVICSGTVFPEVKIEISHSRMITQKEIKHQKFYLYEGEICIGDILPSDVYNDD